MSSAGISSSYTSYGNNYHTHILLLLNESMALFRCFVCINSIIRRAWIFLRRHVEVASILSGWTKVKSVPITLLDNEPLKMLSNLSISFHLCPTQVHCPPCSEIQNTHLKFSLLHSLACYQPNTCISIEHIWHFRRWLSLPLQHVPLSATHPPCVSPYSLPLLPFLHNLSMALSLPLWCFFVSLSLPLSLFSLSPA